MLAVAMGQFDGLARSLAEVIEFCTSALSAADGFYIDYIRRVKREDTFDTFVIDDSADGEGGIDAAASAGDNCTAEYLDTFFVAFLDFADDVDCVADFKERYIFFKGLAFDCVQQFGFHRCISFFTFFQVNFYKGGIITGFVEKTRVF